MQLVQALAVVKSDLSRYPISNSLAAFFRGSS
jgi:hypothetical protein